MSAVAISLIAMYAFAAIVVLICILKDMRRSILRAGVSLGLAMLAIPSAIFITHHTLDRVTVRLLHMIDMDIIAPLTEAFPSLEESMVALVHMVVASEIYVLVFWSLMSLLGVISHFVCRWIEQKKPALAKKSKPVGALIGVAFSVVVLVACMAPTAGYAAEAPEILHVLGEYEQIAHEGAEDLSDEALQAQRDAQKTANTVLLKAVRALGGDAIFRATTTVEVNGVTTDLCSEFHSLDALGAQVVVLTATPVKEYDDEQYDTIKQMADVVEESALLRVLSAEGLSSLSKAWKNGEDFLGMPKPTEPAALEVAVNVVLKRFENTTQDTVAEDIRKLAPAVATAIKAFNMYSTMQSTDPNSPSSPSDPSTPTISETIEAVIGSLDAALEDEETKTVAIEIGLGVIAKELEQYFVTDKRPAASDPSEDDEPGGDVVTDIVDDTVDQFLPGVDEDFLPPDTEITQEEYDNFMSGVTDLAISGAMGKPTEEAVEHIKDVRDAAQIDLPDELCEELINAVMNSPYASLFQ